MPLLDVLLDGVLAGLAVSVFVGVAVVDVSDDDAVAPSPEAAGALTLVSPEDSLEPDELRESLR